MLLQVYAAGQNMKFVHLPYWKSDLCYKVHVDGPTKGTWICSILENVIQIS